MAAGRGLDVGTNMTLALTPNDALIALTRAVGDVDLKLLRGELTDPAAFDDVSDLVSSNLFTFPTEVGRSVRMAGDYVHSARMLFAQNDTGAAHGYLMRALVSINSVSTGVAHAYMSAFEGATRLPRAW